MFLLAVLACADATAPTISSVAFEADAITLLTEDVAPTHVTVRNSRGETVADAQVTYSTSAGFVATVNTAGAITAVAPGTATITAAVGSVTDALQVTVNAPPVQSVDLQIANPAVFVEDIVATSITVVNTKGKPATNAAVTYTTSAPGVATVDGIGRVIGVGNGTATITATAEGKSDQVDVTVTWPPVASLTFTRDTATLLLDDSLATSVVVMNSRGRVARNAIVTYGSSAGGVATIDAKGMIHTTGTGAATLSADVEGFHDEIALNVMPQFTSLFLGEIHTCGISGIGGLWCWGSDAARELGQPQQATCVAAGDCSLVPLRVQGNQHFVSAALGTSHTCALTDTGAAYCWGTNDLAQYGNGTTSVVPAGTPVAVSGGLSFMSLSAGRWHTCGITSTGDTYCWGWDHWGQLGSGTAPSDRCPWAGSSTPCSPVPVKVVGNHAFVSIAAAEKKTCGRTAAGDIYCWGLEVGGTESADCQGGTNNTCTRTPLLMGTTSSATSAGLFMTGGMICGRSAAGAASCLGYSYAGEFGNGVAAANSPTIFVSVAGGATFAQVAGGRTHICARHADGAATCWGAGNYGSGEPGTDRLAPTAVAGGITFATLFGSPQGGTTCGLSTTGRAYCWGDGRFGEVGDGAALVRYEPALVKLAR
jgi:alpha-tubulin suppressor-like RCC1 family protein